MCSFLATRPPLSCRFECERLTSLNLQHNCFERLPAAIGSLGTLKLLKVSSNELFTLPDEMATLTSLAQLDISDNQCVPCTAVEGIQLMCLRLDTRHPKAELCTSAALTTPLS